MQALADPPAPLAHPTQHQQLTQPGPRRAYIFGSVAFILIGAMHTFVHATELFGPELQARFAAMGDIELNGSGPVPSWDLFQGVSWLMGFFAIALGLANLGALGRNEHPPAMNCIVTMAMLATITVIGWAYLGPLQLFGGPFGIALYGYALVGPRLRRR